VWLLKDTYPFSLLYGAVAPIITQLQTTAQSLLAGPLGLWQQAETQVPWIDDAVKMGGTSALTATIIKYVGGKAKAKLEQTVKQTTSELKNHTSENKTLKEANTQLQEKNETILTLTSQLQSGYEDEIKGLNDQLKAKDEQIQKEIQKRITAEQNLTQKTQDAILEKTRMH